MGCFDTIDVYMECPYCKRHQSFDAQTKDMSSGMWHFNALDENWFNKKKEILGRKFRQNLPIFKQFPFDKETPWKTQAENIEARAQVEPTWGKQLRFVEVTVDCKSTDCDTWARERDMRQGGYVSGFGRMFDGKIAIIEHKGKYYFIAPIYDIVKNDKKLPRKPKKERKPDGIQIKNIG